MFQKAPAQRAPLEFYKNFTCMFGVSLKFGISLEFDKKENSRRLLDSRVRLEFYLPHGAKRPGSEETVSRGSIKLAPHPQKNEWHDICTLLCGSPRYIHSVR